MILVFLYFPFFAIFVDFTLSHPLTSRGLPGHCPGAARERRAMAVTRKGFFFTKYKRDVDLLESTICNGLEFS
uniref:Putative secreted protein n=1 Tax=Anopheles triannulatus TaxID=58253 RepID=A0A2M4B2K0_9DIPT